MVRAVAAFSLLVMVSLAQAQHIIGGYRLAVAKVGDDGRLLVTAAQMQAMTRQGTVNRTVYEDVQKTRTVERDGQQVTEAYTEKVPRTMTETMTYTVMVPAFQTTAADAGQVRAAEVSGTAVPAGDLANRLRAATTVLYGYGPPLPDYYRTVFRPETLVLTVPAQPFAPPPAQAPPPAVAEPSGPPPDVVFVSFGADGTFDVRQFGESQFIKVMKHGEGPEAKVFNVAATNRTSVITHYPVAVVGVSTADGKPVEVAALRRSLTKEGAAVASSDGKPVDPLWLKALKPTTLVIDGPEQNVDPAPMARPTDGFVPPAQSPAPQKVQPVAPQPVAPSAVPQPVKPAAPPSNDSAAGPKAGATADERAVVEGTNAERKNAGLKPLKVDPALAKAARAHAEAMAKANELNHTLGGKGLDARLAAAGFVFREAGENIAQGARTPAEAVSDWMNSPGHRANILTAGFERIGVGTATSAAGERFWCQVFGTRLEAPSAPAAAPVAAQ